MRIREWTERVRHSLWFVPGLAVVLAAGAALGMVALSDAIGQTGAELPIVFGAGPEGARAMLQAIAGSVITVAGVTFSITIVALQLTSTQFSPRVLRNFLRDRPNQLVLGAFMGTYTYALLVLRSIRAEDELRGPAFVPGPAITGALVLAFVSLGMLIYFIHHISVRIQVTSIVASVAQDSTKTVDALTRWNAPDAARGWLPVRGAPIATAPAMTVRAVDSGYLQMIDLAHLVRVASEAGARIRLLLGPGAWVQAGAAVAEVIPPPADPEATESAFGDALGLGDERSMTHDVAFGIQQLVDIGVKALSPSVNDPTTAMNVIDRLVEVLAAAGTAEDPPRIFADTAGTVRLDVPMPGFDALVPLAFDQVRHYGASTPAVVIHLARSIGTLRSVLPPERHPALLDQARFLIEAASAIEPEGARQRTLTAAESLLH